MLRFYFLPHRKLFALSSSDRVKVILELLKTNHILVIEGKLRSTEEALLIRETMQFVGSNLEDFSGIEIGVLQDHDDIKGFEKFKHTLAQKLTGDKSGFLKK